MKDNCVFVEIVAQGPACVLCQLAIASLEAVSLRFLDLDKGNERLTWAMVDSSTREGIERLRELYTRLDTRIAVPSILINEQVAFDHIPDEDSLIAAIRRALDSG